MAAKKMTVTQKAVGLAAPVLPAPVAKVVTTRWGSRLFILLLPFLLATGILTITWNNGIPTVNFDRAKAWLVGQQVGERVSQEAMRAAQEFRERQGVLEPGSGQVQPTSWPQPSYQGPTYQQPAYQQPAYQQPAYQQPAYQQPAYQQPGLQPITQQPYSPAPYPAPQPQQAAQPWGPRAYR